MTENIKKPIENNIQENVENKKTEITETKKPAKKIAEMPKKKKEEAMVKGLNIHISTKHSIAICNFIRNKNIEHAITELERAQKMKIAIPMRGEIPHRKGIMSGRYPIKAIGEFIRLLKSLKSNAIANEIDLEKVKISCKANVASRPYKRFGKGRFKRTNLEIKLIPIIKIK